MRILGKDNGFHQVQLADGSVVKMTDQQLEEAAKPKKGKDAPDETKAVKPDTAEANKDEAKKDDNGDEPKKGKDAPDETKAVKPDTAETK